MKNFQKTKLWIFRILGIIFLIFFQTMLYAQFDGITIGKPIHSLDTLKITNKIGSSNSDNVYVDYTLFTFYGEKPESAQLTFYKNRLSQVEMKFSPDRWEAFETKIKEKYGDTWSGKIKKTEGNYWGDSKAVSVFMKETEGKLIVRFSDQTQMNMAFSDFLNPMILYPILSIVGLFILYLVIANYWVSRCPKCKTQTMVAIEGVERSNYKDYSTGFLSTPEYYEDRTNVYKCKKCGYTEKYTSSGFWQWYQNKHK